MIARLRWFYFLAYAGVGTWQSYFAEYLHGLGFTGEQIGAVTMVQSLVAAPAALTWGVIGDRLGSPVRALHLCAAGAAVSVIGIPLARTPLQMGVVLALAASFGPGIIPLVDSTTVRTVKTGYARVRLFGSLGFVTSAPLLGFLLTLRGDRPGDLSMPIAYTCIVVTNALLAQTFPRGEASEDRPHWRDTAALLRLKPLLFLLGICALHWCALSPYHLMFGVRVRDAALPSSITGLAMSLGVIAEVGALAIFPRLEERFSLRALLAAAFSVTALRWFLLGRAESAVALISLQILHGASFGIWWGGAIEAMQRIVPTRLRATGQALFSAVVFGAGSAIGNALSGAGYDRFGSVGPLFICAGAVELAALALLLLPLTPERGRA